MALENLTRAQHWSHRREEVCVHVCWGGERAVYISFEGGGWAGP